MTVLALAVVAAAVVAGAGLQRVAGLGLGMVASPIMSLVAGPLVGVTMSNVAACIGAAVLLTMLWRDVDWSRFARLAPLLVVGSIVGAVVVRAVSDDVLDLLLGTCVLVAIAAGLGLQRRLTATGPGIAYAAGASAGFMNTVSGVGGPALAAYAVATRWNQNAMAATLQPVFLLSNGLSIITKSVAGARPPAGFVPWWAWAVIAAAVFVGIGLGSLVRPRVGEQRARALALLVATTGALVASTRGLIGLLG